MKGKKKKKEFKRLTKPKSNEEIKALKTSWYLAENAVLRVTIHS